MRVSDSAVNAEPHPGSAESSKYPEYQGIADLENTQHRASVGLFWE